MRMNKKVQGNDKDSVNNDAQLVDVLYHKLGDRWFAFSQVGDEIFVGSLSQEEIDAAEANLRRENKVHRRVGRS